MEEQIPKEQFDPGKFLKRFWPYLAGGVALVLLISYLLFRYAMAGPRQDDGGTQATSTAIGTTSTTSLVGRNLDGVLVERDQAKLMPLAVMIEMHPDARPLSGISKASLVFEAPVEGGITRLMAVFDATTTVESVGPVRSARPYFVEWADGLNALYAHVGGSPEAMNRLAGLLKFRNFDEMANGKYYWRSKQRYAPHNAYTSQENMLKGAAAKKWEAESFTSWAYDSSTGTVEGDVLSVKIPYGGSYTVTWKYDKERDVYVRYQGSAIFKDADGTPIESKNIIVMNTEERVLDDYGRLYIRTTGSGKAVLYRDGNRQDVRWSRSPGEHVRIETTDGISVPLARGTTWIEVVTRAEQMQSAGTSSTTESGR